MSTSKSGTGHFLEMTISSIALLALIPLFIVIVGPVIGEDYEVVTKYFSRPFPAIVFAITMTIVLLHFKSGVVTLIEDYVDHPARRLWIFVMSCVSYLSIALVVLATLRLAI
jgi:succinate dehydrogenase / fumarate reductase membrane anchor subunit|tara:strand:- start:7250 stop:7585 length:336 start_codon:yes stop_codon:yes gene_type:complete